MTIPSNEVPRYSRDMSGELPANLVNERVTLTSVNRTDFNIILPRCAPFFHDSVKLRKIETNEILEFGKDFYIGGIFEGITPYTKHNKDVGSIIILLDQWVGGNYDLFYQTVGGDYILDEERYAEALKNASINPILTRWEDLHGKPIEYPAGPHEHDATDTLDYDAFINELSRLRQTVETWTTEDRKGSPSYIQILQLLFEQGRIINGLSSRVSQVQDDLNSSTAGAIDRTLKKVEAIGKEAERLSKSVEVAVSGQLGHVKDELTAKIEEKVNELHQNNTQTNIDLTRQITALEERANAKIKDALDKLATITAAQSGDLTGLRNELTTTLNNLIATNTAALNKLKTDTEQRVNTVINRSVKLDADTQTLSGKLKALQFESDKVGHDQTYTKYATDARNGDKLESYVQGEKKAEQDSKLLNVLTPAQVAVRLSLKQERGQEDYKGLRLNGDTLEYLIGGINLKEGSGTPTYGNIRAANFLTADGTNISDKFVPFTGGNMQGPLRLFTSNPFDETWTDDDARWGYSGFLRPNKNVTDDSVADAQGQLQIRILHPHYQGKNLPYAQAHGRTIEFNYGSHSNYRVWTGGWDQYGNNYRKVELLTVNHITTDASNTSSNKILSASAINQKFNQLAESARSANESLNTFYANTNTPDYGIGLVVKNKHNNPKSIEMWMSNGVVNDAMKINVYRTNDSTSLDQNNWISIRGALNGSRNVPFMDIYPDRLWTKAYGNLHDYFLPRSLTHYSVPNHWTSCDLMKDKIPYIHPNGHFYAGFQLHLKSPPGHAEQGRVVHMKWAKDDAHGGDGVWCSGWMSVHHLQVRSDQRLKREIKPIYNALEKVSALHGYTYQMKDEPRGRHAGVIAQEVLAVLPEAVSKNDDGFLEVDYNGVLSLLLEAVNELREENISLKARVKALEGE